MKLLVIGCGKMGGAMLAAWLDNNQIAQATIVDPHPDRIKTRFADFQNKVTVLEDCAALPDAATYDAVLLAVKPQQMTAVLTTLAPKLAPQTLLMTIAAGLGVDFYRASLKTNPIVRLMPNTPAMLGAGMTGGYADAAIAAEDLQRVEKLMTSLGDFIWVNSEDELNSVAAISGSGPAYVFYFTEALAAAGVAQGLSPDVAMRLARQTVVGAGAMLAAQPDTPPAQLRADVTSKGGVTAAAIAVLETQGQFNRLIADAISANLARSRELAAQS